jgi:hypothetical protein
MYSLALLSEAAVLPVPKPIESALAICCDMKAAALKMLFNSIKGDMGTLPAGPSPKRMGDYIALLLGAIARRVDYRSIPGDAHGKRVLDL